MDLRQWILCTAEAHSTSLIQESHKSSGHPLFHRTSVTLQRKPAISFRTEGSHITALTLCFSSLKWGVRLDQLRIQPIFIKGSLCAKHCIISRLSLW